MTSDLSGFRSIGFSGFDFLDFAKRFDVVFAGDYEAFIGAQAGSGRNQRPPMTFSFIPSR